MTKPKAGTHMLSTSFTWVIKFSIYPVMIISAICGLLILYMEPTLWVLSLIAFALSFFFYWLFADIKSVEMDEINFRISNFIHTEIIPLQALHQVYEDRLIVTSFIRLRFKYKTKFGQEIKFIPYFEQNLFNIKSHTVYTQLKKLTR